PELIDWDYRQLGHSVRGHPLAGLRQALRRLGLPDARAVNRMPDGRRVRFAGAVINRQRPGTANGVTFMTLEDETGWVNLIVWEAVFRRFEVVGKTAPLLGVTGKLQKAEGVVHLIAEELWIPDVAGRPKTAASRDFR
ncbi:MAG: OB-fold nucleic acid binding domain-containing protein, partial [SAR324 cluster bacterium]